MNDLKWLEIICVPFLVSVQHDMNFHYLNSIRNVVPLFNSVLSTLIFPLW